MINKHMKMSPQYFLSKSQKISWLNPNKFKHKAKNLKESPLFNKGNQEEKDRIRPLKGRKKLIKI